MSILDKILALFKIGPKDSTENVDDGHKPTAEAPPQPKVEPKEPAQSNPQIEYKTRPTALVVTRCSFAHRVAESITTGHDDLFNPVFVMKQDMSAQGNYFQGFLQGLSSKESFAKTLTDKKVLDAELIDDFMALGGGSCGGKLVELDTMLKHTATTSRVNLNLVISERASNLAEETACVVNSLLALNFLAQLDAKYNDRLSITFISNKRLKCLSHDTAAEYADSNRALAKHFITERQMNRMKKIRLIDMVGRFDGRFSTIGFASSPTKQSELENKKAADALLESVKKQMWLSGGDINFTQNQLPLRSGKLIVVIPPGIYQAMNSQHLIQRIVDGSAVTPPSTAEEDESKGGMADAVNLGNTVKEAPDTGQESLEPELVPGVDQGQKEIYGICRRIIKTDHIEKYFAWAREECAKMCKDACQDKPQGLLGKQCRVLYKGAYHHYPTYTKNNGGLQGFAESELPIE